MNRLKIIVGFTTGFITAIILLVAVAIINRTEERRIQDIEILDYSVDCECTTIHYNDFIVYRDRVGDIKAILIKNE